MSIKNLILSDRKSQPFSCLTSIFIRNVGWFINWPEGISFLRWQNLLKSSLHFLGKQKATKRSSKTKKRGGLIHLKKRVAKRTEPLCEEMAMKALGTLHTRGSVDCGGKNKLELITLFKQFLERKNLSSHIEKVIPDHRNKELITYSKQSIMMSALAIFFFRMTSGNKYDDKCHDRDEKYSMTNIAKFIDAPENRVPVIKTIESFLKTLTEGDVNALMITFFKDLQASKFFRQHPQIMFGDFFLLSADCVHTHTYDHPHHVDKQGNNDCLYCLKRVYNKGTEHEKVRWVHCTLVFSFVFMSGLKVPIYYHSIRAKQISCLENASESKHKQECELVALKVTLPVLRQAFPKMKIAFLLDGLYANRPVIRMMQNHKCGYIIVRKDGCLTSLAQDCDGQSKLPNHRKNRVKRNFAEERGWQIERRYEWFNSVDIGEQSNEELKTNVLRFWETRKKNGKVKTYHCEWLFSWRLSGSNCEASAVQGRARWEEEDLFNTLKNRGFNLKHDYSRSPLSLFNWQGLALFAFGLFELFRFSEVVRAKGRMPQMTLAEKLLGQLLYRPTEELFSGAHLSIKVQFRYNFILNLTIETKTHPIDTPVGFRGG